MLASVSRDHIWKAETKLYATFHPTDKRFVHPANLLHFAEGDLILWLSLPFSNFDSKAVELFIMKHVKGIYR